MLVDSLISEGGVELNRIFSGLDDDSIDPGDMMHEFRVEFDVPLSKSLVTKSL